MIQRSAHSVHHFSCRCLGGTQRCSNIGLVVKFIPRCEECTIPSVFRQLERTQPIAPVHPLQTAELHTLVACDGMRQIRAALGLWDGSGAFVFTSSTGVYAEDGRPCSEGGPLLAQGHSERTDRRGLGQ